ncbi:hypothetical protein CEP51_015874 [Fusarium floridanum]|uniref:Uncharacterized protein n=1 Tax=Fusarium floridanum TaxID=1325733 RepID=A0A428P1A5_9HYPO|nr:hypothetical protein CEP51_015874 [Fusarium floridanum]
MSRIQQRSSLSRALDTLSGLATRIHCVEDEEFDAGLVAFLVPHLNDDNARRRLLSFLDHNNGTWACLASICVEGYGVRKVQHGPRHRLPDDDPDWRYQGMVLA